LPLYGLERTELLARDIENYEQKLPTKFSPRFQIVHLFNAASVDTSPQHTAHTTNHNKNHAYLNGENTWVKRSNESITGAKKKKTGVQPVVIKNRSLDPRGN
jgi:hypothetical protein